MKKPRRARKPLHHHLIDYFFPHKRNGYRPHFFSVKSVVFIVGTVLLLEAGYIAQVKLVFPNTNFLASVLPGVLATLTNEARAASDALALSRNAQLDKAAQLAADDMAAKGYFAHVSPDGKDPWYWLNQAGYLYSYAGENLAVNFSDSDALQNAWMASPTHHANIVKPEYTEIGFGMAQGVYEGKETTFVVEFFATPATAGTNGRETPPVAVVQKPAATATQAGETGTVLGTETPSAVTVTQPQPEAVAVTEQPPVQEAREIPNAVRTTQSLWFDRLLASPLTVAEIMLAILFMLVALLVIIATLRRYSFPHPQVMLGGALLLALSFGLLALNPLFVGHVEIPVGDTLTASAVSALGQ